MHMNKVEFLVLYKTPIDQIQKWCSKSTTTYLLTIIINIIIIYTNKSIVIYDKK